MNIIVSFLRNLFSGVVSAKNMLQGQHTKNFKAKLWQFFLRNINKLLTVIECFSTSRGNNVKNITFSVAPTDEMQQHFLYCPPRE